MEINKEQSSPFEFADTKEGKGIQVFFYLRNGLSILNEFKNLIMFVFGVYFTLKLDSWVWLVVMFIVALPILAGIGYLFVKRWNKILEWISIRYGTHYAIKQFTIYEEILNTLKDINSKIDKK